MRLKMFIITLLTVLALILVACTAANPSSTPASLEAVPATEMSTEQGGNTEMMNATKVGDTDGRSAYGASNG